VNLLTIVFVILVIWSMYRGLKSGFAKEVNGLVSLFMALVVLSVTLLLIGSILQKNTKLAVISVIMLTIVSFLYRLLKTVMHSIETVAELPVISLLNTIAGALAGGSGSIGRRHEDISCILDYIYHSEQLPYRGIR